MNKKIVRYLLAFVLVIIALGFWYFKKNAFSKEILKLEILGPETVEVGQKADYILKYKNNGEITLTGVRLTFEFPGNSIVEAGKGRIEQALEDIYPGEEKTIAFSAIILGQENELKKAKAWLNFQPKNLKARYEVSTSQTAVIKFSPLSFEFDIASKIEASKDFSFSLNYFSNVDYPLSQLRVKVDYASGFEFSGSNPQALEKNEWQLPILNKTEGGRIKISGRMTGNVGEQKIFKASLGMWTDQGFVLLKEISKGVEIIKPMIYLSQLVNGSSYYVSSPGDFLHYEIFFKNIGSSPFENLFLVVGLEGSLFDLSTLRSPNANYHQGDNSMVWDWKKNPQLKFLDEDEEGKVEFWINLKKELPKAELKDRNMVLKTNVNLSPAKEEFLTKVNSMAILDQQAFFSNSWFESSGSLPLQAGQLTSVVVSWKLKNYYNDLKGVKVKATLPAWASLTGQIEPRNSSFTFDSASREIVWEVGEVKARQGVSIDGPGLAFQVSLAPDSSHRGQALAIVDNAQAFGEDVWTQEKIVSELKSINTGMLGDEGFNPIQGIVQ